MLLAHSRQNLIYVSRLRLFSTEALQLLSELSRPNHLLADPTACSQILLFLSNPMQQLPIPLPPPPQHRDHPRAFSVVPLSIPLHCSARSSRTCLRSPSPAIRV